MLLHKLPELKRYLKILLKEFEESTFLCTKVSHIIKNTYIINIKNHNLILKNQKYLNFSSKFLGQVD